MPLAASAMRMTPTPIREVSSHGTMDVFPSYDMSPDVSFYDPATSPVTPTLIANSDFLSPAGEEGGGGEGGGGRRLWMTCTRVTAL